MHLEITYDPPAGVVGATIAKLFGKEPGQQVASDLRRLKQVLETGEAILSERVPGDPTGGTSRDFGSRNGVFE